MPSVQRGRVEKLPSGRWSVRFYDETGARKRQGGFGTKTEARAWADRKAGEVAALRRGDPAAVRRQQMPTLNELCDEFLAQHTAEPNTLRGLREWLVSSRRTFGQVRVDRLVAHEIALWRKTCPERSAWHYTKALRQVLNYAVRAQLIERNAAAEVPNARPKPREVQAFASPADVEAVAAEMWVEKAPHYAVIPMFAAWTGLRPEEWLALERGDVDRAAGVIHVRRVYTDGQVKLHGKNSRSLRAVPLPLRAAQALAELPPRLDTQLLFPGERGGHLNLDAFRRNYWNPAVRAAGLEHRTLYALRHTFATWAIAAGIGLFELSRLMGTSVDQLDRTYGHMLPDSLDRARTALDLYVSGAAQAAEEAR
jgi:integrase